MDPVRVGLYSSKGLPVNLPPDLLASVVDSVRAQASTATAPAAAGNAVAEQRAFPVSVSACVPDVVSLRSVLAAKQQRLTQAVGIDTLVQGLWLVFEDQCNIDALPFGNDGIMYHCLGGRHKV
jgi:hypothetical protein